MENGSYTIETDFGCGGEKKKITFYRCLKGNENAKNAVDLISKLRMEIYMVQMKVKDDHPEYDKELLELQRMLVKWGGKLGTQYEGTIVY